MSATYYKDPTDPQWDDDPEMKLYYAKLKQYAPDADPAVPFHTFGWAAASSFHKAMEAAKCPTREGLRDAMRSARGRPGRHAAARGDAEHRRG